MKTQNRTQTVEVTENKTTVATVEFGDVLVYNEMADQTSVKLNLIEQIHSQLNQLEELNQKRNFLMKEVLEIIR